MPLPNEAFDPRTIDVDLVRQLVRAQFPQWAQLPLTPAVPQGWDNRTFRLGAELSVRLPSAAGYAPQIAKEQCWLPCLAPQLPLPIPAPLALGAPGAGFPWQWSIYRWREGEVAGDQTIADLTAFATALGQFFAALQRINACDGPQPGVHSAFRGGPLTTYDAETRRAITALGTAIDGAGAQAVWEAARAARWDGPPVWFHGDVAVGNLLVREGRLAAVIDFGCAGVGDPACDLVIAWTLLSGESREAFRAGLSVDDATWARGRGWPLWKALITVVEYRDSDQRKAKAAHSVISTLLHEQRALGG